MKRPTSTRELLKQRGKTNGDYSLQSSIAQELKQVCWNSGCYDGLSASQKESLEMIFHKVGRILAGNPDHKDHWDDIAGYATLISIQLED